MLGLLRFVLAMCVVACHLAQDVQFFWHWGGFAVFGFYVVSGYLMTRILNETYAFHFWSFAANRFLRLFPIYYLVAVGSTLVILVAPSASGFHNAWEAKYRILDLLGNGLIFPFEFYDASFRILPQTWSIAVELINYFLLWLVVARDRRLAVVALLLALIYHAATLVLDMHWSTRYFPSYAALLPFSLGACIYFFGDISSNFSTGTIRRIAVFSFLFWIANLVLCGLVTTYDRPYFNLFFYVNLASVTVFVYFLTRSPLHALLPRIGKVLGDLAYPVFLTHWIVGFAMSLLVLEGQRRGLSLLAVSVLPILVVSFVLSWWADRWLEPLRNKVRSKARFSSLDTGEPAWAAVAGDGRHRPSP